MFARVAVGIATTACLASCSVAGGGPDGGPDGAVTGFSADPETIDDAFAELHAHVRERPDALRAVALDRLDDENPSVHYAALYALSLTAESGESMDALRPYLASDELDDRFLAAGSLLARGEKEAIPVLIGLLDAGGSIAYRDPPRAAAMLARSVLLAFVEGDDHGLADAGSLEQVSATKPAWERWWEENGSAVEWTGSHYRGGG